MSIKIALIALLSAYTISALSIAGFQCRERTVMTGDPAQPVRTVRICGVEDYAAPASFLDYHKPAPIEPNAIAARHNYAAGSYDLNSFWPKREAPTSAYARWPLQRPTESNESEQLLATILRGLAVQPTSYEAAATNYATNAGERTEAERLLQEKLRSITEDTDEVKNSLNDVVANVKNILDTLVVQSAHQPKDINVNVNLKLDAALEGLLRDFIALIKDEANSEASAEPTSTAHIADSSADDSEDYARAYSTSYANENSSEEQVTEAGVDSAERSTEEDAKEEYEGNSSVEDFDSWLRLRFGPIVRASTYDENTDNSEQEHSAEKSEESFESWFNAVYRKHTTQAPTVRYSSDEQSASQESAENATKESMENLQESDDQYSYVDAAKSSEENTVSAETTESSEEVDNTYDSIFVPTTMNAQQTSEEAELLENGDKYNYAIEKDKATSIPKKYICTDFGNQPSLSEFEKQGNYFVKCYLADEKAIPIGESKSREEIETASTESNESKSSEETETPINESNESESSEETETAITESNESKSSEETETLINESTESKSSEETESPINESNESKSSEETESPINESNESKSSQETETPIPETNESEDISEVASDINFSAEPRVIDWYQYDDEYPYIQ